MYRMCYIEAIDIICLHSTSVHTILGRKSLKKEHIFRYLHNKNVPVTNDLAKLQLIDRLLKFWETNFALPPTRIEMAVTDEIPPLPMTPPPSQAEATYTLGYGQSFPINVLARQFAMWFFDNLNKIEMQAHDLWDHCVCKVQFYEHKTCLVDEEFIGPETVIDFIRSLVTDYNLHLNLNIDHSGTQGRTDPHGLVLVLACGTLHKHNQFVGIFESILSIARDPFTRNHWKVSRINMRLTNFGDVASIAPRNNPTLRGSASLEPYLALEMPEDRINGM